MSNVNSSGKFGTSMDYSMLLRLKKHNVLTAAYNATVSPVNAVFNRDKKTRGFDNGVVDVLFQKGLFLANKTSSQLTESFDYILPDAPSESTIGSRGVPYGPYLLYSEAVQNYPDTAIPQEIINAFIPFSPFTARITNNTGGESLSITLSGNVVEDKVAVTQYQASLDVFSQLDGDSFTITFTWKA
jgi:hypothetical protein